ncbi:hypothetical protein J6590_042672 [Homalodisca vitripennis]|nr:hypothetical protein J6590_042672 [Homalodisca vitripennis]
MGQTCRRGIFPAFYLSEESKKRKLAARCGEARPTRVAHTFPWQPEKSEGRE